MNRFILRNNWLKFKAAGKLPNILDEFMEYTPNLIKGNRRMSTCNRSDLQTLGSQPVMPNILPDHWLLGLKLMPNCAGPSARKVLGHIESVKILVILNPTGYMLTSSGFAFIHLRYPIDSSKMIVTFPHVLNFNR